jgi:hypothetical protein
VLTAYAPVEPLGWLVFIELPVDEAYAPLYSGVERSGLVVLAALGLAFFVSACCWPEEWSGLCMPCNTAPPGSAAVI